MYLNAELFRFRRASLHSHGTSRVVSTNAEIFSSLIDGCLKYKNKEKPKTGPRPGLRLNYDANIGPKPSPSDVKKSEPDFKLNICNI